MTGNGDRPTPRETIRLLGQDAAEGVLLEAWNSGRMPHAWLLAGPRGVGKATLAYRMARFVLSREAGGGMFDDSPPADSLAISGEHTVSRRIAAGGQADLLCVERSVNRNTGKLRGEIAVEDVRRLSSFLALTTAGGGWRVVIVDVADEMNKSAANALLKGLEEPPSRTLFLLVSHSPGRLLPTIRSRCRTLNLPPLAEEAVHELLETLAPGLAESDARAIARLSDGGIGQALALVDGGGLDLYRDVVTLLSQGNAAEIRAVQALGGKVGRADAGDSFDMLGRLIDRWLSGMILGQARGAMPPDVVEGEGAAARSLRARASLANWLEVWEKVARLFSQAGSANLDRRQVVVNAFLALQATTRG